jgi:Ca-activated chloride channel family protein
MLLDISGSMTNPLTGSICKFDAARNAIGSMINGKRTHHRDDGIAIVVFSDNAAVISLFRHPGDPLLISRLNNIRMGSTTNISAGLQKALQLHSNLTHGRHKNIILATDGMPYPHDTKSSVLSVAKSAYNQRVTIHTIGIGSTNDFDPGFLQSVAQSTHKGRYWHVSDLTSFASAVSDASYIA